MSSLSPKRGPKVSTSFRALESCRNNNFIQVRTICIGNVMFKAKYNVISSSFINKYILSIGNTQKIIDVLNELNNAK